MTAQEELLLACKEFLEVSDGVPLGLPLRTLRSNIVAAVNKIDEEKKEARRRIIESWATAAAQQFEDAMMGTERVGSYSLHRGINCLRLAALELLEELK